MVAAGAKRRLGLFPLLLLLAGAMVSGMLLVAWRRLDDSAPPAPADRRSGLYQPQGVFFNSEGESGGVRSGVAGGVEAAAPVKTLVIYVYHER